MHDVDRYMAGKCIRPMAFPELEDGPVMLEYVMVDHTRIRFFSRMYTLDTEPQTVSDCTVKCITMYDTAEMKEPCPELAMTPVALFRDPFRLGRHKIVLCVPEYFDKPGKTVVYNTRSACVDLFNKIADYEPLFGIEQEYYVVDKNDRPLDWDKYPPDCDLDCELGKGDYMQLERDLIETHVQACLYAGVKIAGMNREVSPSEWEYQIGPLDGVRAADHVVVARYILERLAERNSIHVTFNNPQCIRNTTARATMHPNFSTRDSRADGGIQHLHKFVENMSKHSQKSVLKYYDLKDGKDMDWFLSGQENMPHYNTFTCKVGNKQESSVRIPAAVAAAGRGYIEDRRPMANADPYDVCRIMATTALFETNGTL